MLVLHAHYWITPSGNVSTAEWGTSAMTLYDRYPASGTNQYYGDEVWYLLNPANSTGATFTVTLTAATANNQGVTIDYEEYSGVNQTTPFKDDAKGEVPGNSALMSVSLTTTVANSIIDVSISWGNSPTVINSYNSGLMTQLQQSSVINPTGGDYNTLNLSIGTYNGYFNFNASVYGAEIMSEIQGVVASTPTWTPTATPSTTPTSTPTWTPTVTPTSTPTFTPTFTPTATPTATPTSTPLYVPVDDFPMIPWSLPLRAFWDFDPCDDVAIPYRRPCSTERRA